MTQNTQERLKDILKQKPVAAAYGHIENFYKDRRAVRSARPYMAHIDEGLLIIEQLSCDHCSDGFSRHDTLIAQQAFCLHPLFQADQDFYAHFTKTPADLKSLKYPPLVLLAVAEYRNLANRYLSGHGSVAALPREIPPVLRAMLLADKIQNWKDLELYNPNHPRHLELRNYFISWLEYLEFWSPDHCRLVLSIWAILCETRKEYLDLQSLLKRTPFPFKQMATGPEAFL